MAVFVPGPRRYSEVRPSRLLLFCIALLIPAAPASAAVPHTVQPGETLWSIAAANNLYTGALAAYNGLPPEANVVLGSTIMIPTAGRRVPRQARRHVLLAGRPRGRASRAGRRRQRPRRQRSAARGDDDQAP